MNKLRLPALRIAIAVLYLGAFGAGNIFAATVIQRFTTDGGSEIGRIEDDGLLIGLTLNASDLTTGTLPDARLSSNVTQLGATVDHSELSNVSTDDHHTATVDTDTNSKTFCSDGEFLRGEASTTCRSAAQIVSDGGGAGHSDGTNAGSGFLCLGTDASGNCQLAVVDNTDGGVNGSTNPVTSNVLFDHEAKSGVHHTATVNTNAETICNGTGNYLDGEGNCDPLVTDTGAPHGNGSNAPSGFLCLGTDASGNCETGIVFDSLQNGATSPVSSNQLFDHDALTGSSAHGAVSANTASQLVTRDGSGNFSAGTITASLTGTASAATALASDPSDCSAGQFSAGINASGVAQGCTDLISEAELDTLSELNTQLGTSIADGAHTTALAASVITAAAFPSGAFSFPDAMAVNGLTFSGATTKALICSTLSCSSHNGTTAGCMAVAVDIGRVFMSSGTSPAGTRGQWNSHDNTGPC